MSEFPGQPISNVVELTRGELFAIVRSKYLGKRPEFETEAEYLAWKTQRDLDDLE